MSGIKIKCEGTDNLALNELKDFQGNLKRRSENHVKQIITSIEKYGFSFPFFVWRSGKSNYVLDGHGRLAALYAMREQGTDIPALPVVYIEAKDKAEAKQKLLRLNSQYGEFDIDGLNDFTDGLEVDWSELALGEVQSAMFQVGDEIPGENKGINEDEFENTENECPKCGFKW